MELFTLMAIISVIHSILYISDVVCQKYQVWPYLYLRNLLGLNINLFQVRWVTTSFNRVFQKWGMWRPKFMRLWFTVGSWVSIFLVVPALGVLVYGIVAHFTKGTDEENMGASLQPVIPGINLPSSHLCYYLLTILATSVVHEVGHAMAAVREDVSICGFGILLVFILPAAFVELHKEQLDSLSPIHQLRVICAGIWHNVVLAIVAFGFLLYIPFASSLLFYHGKGVAITQIAQNSPVMGPTGLVEGDHILRVNQCPVYDAITWQKCLTSVLREPVRAYCVSNDLVHQYDESVPVRQLPRGSVECCGANSPNHLCFEYLEHDKNAAVLPQFTCLPVRTVLEQTYGLCQVSDDCLRDSYCLKPSLDNFTRLVQVKRRQKSDMLFLGNPAEMYYSTGVVDYVPKYSFVSPYIPPMIETLCKYILAFSAALALLNVVPCYALDGQYLTKALVNYFLGETFHSQESKNIICVMITAFGTLLIAVNVILGVTSLL